MKRSLILLLASTIAIAVLLSILPWWSTVVVALVAGSLSSLKILPTFLVLFFAGLLAWGGSATWVDALHIKPVADLLADMGLGQSLFAYLATAVVGGLAAGFAAALSRSVTNIGKTLA